MNRRLSALLTTAVTAAVLVAAPAAHADQVASATDPAGDVKLLSDSGGLTVEQRRSIDLRKVAINVGADSTRFVIRLNRITIAKSFDQMVFLTLKSPAGANPAYRTDIGISAQTRDLAYAYYSPDITADEQVVCDPLTAQVRMKLHVVFLDVPHECLPTGAVKIKLTSATGAFRSEGTGFSRDTMKIPGTPELQ